MHYRWLAIVVSAACLDVEPALEDASQEVTFVTSFGANDWILGATVQISTGNFLTSTARIEYDVDVTRCFFGCSTGHYKISIGRHGGTLLSYRASMLGHTLETRVGPGAGASLIYDSVVQPAHIGYGPFVLSIDQVVNEQTSPKSGLYLLVDEQVLSRLPAPTLVNGIPLFSLAARAKWTDLVDSRRALIDTFRFRGELWTMTSVFSPDELASALTTVIESGDPMFWHVHGEVNHAVPIGTEHPDPVVADHDDGIAWLGGFFNGHRRYMRMMETQVRALAMLPFGRVPMWDPGTPLFRAFTAGTAAPENWLGGSAPGNVSYLEICNLPTVEALFNAIGPWHSSVHTNLGGPFGNVHTAAQAPVFFPWHTAVDQLWANWQQCMR